MANLQRAFNENTVVHTPLDYITKDGKSEEFEQLLASFTNLFLFMADMLRKFEKAVERITIQIFTLKLQLAEKIENYNKAQRIIKESVANANVVDLTKLELPDEVSARETRKGLFLCIDNILGKLYETFETEIDKLKHKILISKQQLANETEDCKTWIKKIRKLYASLAKLIKKLIPNVDFAGETENSLFAKVERLQELQKKWTDDIKIYYQIKRQWRYKVKSLETKIQNLLEARLE
ncbi:uncharacterized protein LOC105195424 isoform X2 [Solenopsis invicta]|uniref:uncharacterized protein LOC105195424 isoform X2 n=1 Tax=Solenopsis invicta TaxID=13686 RepID=UPI000596284D|nr:uncharacterized protein LOC105195424 isoform X2 [Solenopsis invicta]